MSTAEIRRHWDRVARLGCCISQSPYPTLHHIHGGSCRDIGLHKGMGQKTSDWLVIPLAHVYHVGKLGIDVIGAVEWEKTFGKQVDLLDGVCRELNLNLWTKALIFRDPWSSMEADPPKKSAGD